MSISRRYYYDFYNSPNISNFPVKAKLQAQYKESIPERVISMALESVDYSEEKALKILDIVIQEDKDSKLKTEKKKGEHHTEKNVSFKESRYVE